MAVYGIVLKNIKAAINKYFTNLTFASCFSGLIQCTTLNCHLLTSHCRQSRNQLPNFVRVCLRAFGLQVEQLVRQVNVACETTGSCCPYEQQVQQLFAIMLGPVSWGLFMTSQRAIIRRKPKPLLKYTNVLRNGSSLRLESSKPKSMLVKILKWCSWHTHRQCNYC